MIINVKKLINSKSRKMILTAFILCIIIGFSLYQIIFTIPQLEQDQQVRKYPTICVHSLILPGSSILELVSYFCDQAPDWDLLQSTTTGADGVKNMQNVFKEEGILDSWVTPECPHLYYEKSRIDSYGVIIMKQGKICKMFAHDYPEPTYQAVMVDEEGVFEVISEVNSEGNSYNPIDQLKSSILDSTHYLQSMWAFMNGRPDFSESDWVIESYADGSGNDTNVYYQTNKKWQQGAVMGNYYIITTTDDEDMPFKIVKLTVDEIQRGYIVSYIPQDQIDIECMKVMSAEGQIIDTDGSIIVDWTPLPGWGESCKDVDWEEEYQKIMKPTISEPTIKRSNIEKPEFEVKTMEGEDIFLLHHDDEELGRYRYKPKSEKTTNSIYVTNMLHADSSVIFYAEQVPLSCAPQSDEELESCQKYFNDVTADYAMYGGLWRVDLSDNSFHHVWKVPNGTKGRLIRLEKLNDVIYIEFDSDITYSISIESGEALNIKNL